MIVDAISDLHGNYPKLEGGDLLIVAGDLTARDNPSQHHEFNLWASKQDYKMVLVVPGNHDNFIQKNHEVGKTYQVAHPPGYKSDVFYLIDSGTDFVHFWSDERRILTGRNFKIWGSPWTKTFPGINSHCKAFTVDTEEELSEKFQAIPNDIDILITHCPQWGILDEVKRIDGTCENTGSSYLRARMERSEKLLLHVFGHIHEHGGRKLTMIRPGVGTENNFILVNASHVNERYQPVNKPVRIIL